MIHAASENPKDDLQYEEMSEVCVHTAPHTQSFTHAVLLLHVAFPLCFTQGEKIVFEYFSDPEFIDQLIEFLSLEDRKGKDSFNPRRFCLFKVQFQLPALINAAILFKAVTQLMTASQG